MSASSSTPAAGAARDLNLAPPFSGSSGPSGSGSSSSTTCLTVLRQPDGRDQRRSAVGGHRAARARAAAMAAVGAVDGLEHHRHEADVDGLLLVEGRATEALGGVGLDLLGLIEEALDGLRELLPT